CGLGDLGDVQPCVVLAVVVRAGPPAADDVDASLHGQPGVLGAVAVDELVQRARLAVLQCVALGRVLDVVIDLDDVRGRSVRFEVPVGIGGDGHLVVGAQVVAHADAPALRSATCSASRRRSTPAPVAVMVPRPTSTVMACSTSARASSLVTSRIIWSSASYSLKPSPLALAFGPVDGAGEAAPGGSSPVSSSLMNWSASSGVRSFALVIARWNTCVIRA